MASELPHYIWQCEELNNLIPGLHGQDSGFPDLLPKSLRAQAAGRNRQEGEHNGRVIIGSEPHFPSVAPLSPFSVFRMSLLGMLFGDGVGLLVV